VCISLYPFLVNYRANNLSCIKTLILVLYDGVVKNIHLNMFIHVKGKIPVNHLIMCFYSGLENSLIYDEKYPSFISGKKTSHNTGQLCSVPPQVALC
jgi:hypothetical protein